MACARILVESVVWSHIWIGNHWWELQGRKYEGLFVCGRLCVGGGCYPAHCVGAGLSKDGTGYCHITAQVALWEEMHGM